MTSTPFRRGFLRGGITGFVVAIVGAGITMLMLRSNPGETLELINYGLYFFGLPVSHLYFVIFPRGIGLERTAEIMIALMTINWAMIGGAIGWSRHGSDAGPEGSSRGAKLLSHCPPYTNLAH